MNYRRISLSVPFDGSIFNDAGKVEFSQTMRNKIYDEEEGFREKIILKINGISQGKWHIAFTEFTLGNFNAAVYVENQEDFVLIKSILLYEFKKNPLESIWKETFREELFRIN